jgi:hypothetical protein
MNTWVASMPILPGVHDLARAYCPCWLVAPASCRCWFVAPASCRCWRVTLAFSRFCIAALAICFCCTSLAMAQSDSSKASRTEPFQGTSSETARLSAIQALPMDKLDAQSRAKVHAVLSNITIFRRMPGRVIDCDPDLYLFLVRHPDVVINIWNTLKISQLQLKQTGPQQFRLNEESGVTANLEYLFRSHDMHLIYAEGVYEGSSFGRQVRGSGLFCLKSGYIRETDGRYYITSRLDAFISVEPSAVEIVAKALHPLLGFTADNNFVQTVAFVGSLSRTTEQSSRSMQRLGTQLNNVQPDVRDEFIKLAQMISEKPSALALRRVSDPKNSARKDNDTIQR